MSVRITSVSRWARWALTPSDLMPPWWCTLPLFQCSQSCLSAAGPVMHFFGTYMNKYKSSAQVWPPEWSPPPILISTRSQILPITMTHEYLVTLEICCTFQYWPWCPVLCMSSKVQSPPLTAVPSILVSYLVFLAKFGVRGKWGKHDIRFWIPMPL